MLLGLALARVLRAMTVVVVVVVAVVVVFAHRHVQRVGGLAGVAALVLARLLVRVEGDVSLVALNGLVRVIQRTEGVRARRAAAGRSAAVGGQRGDGGGHRFVGRGGLGAVWKVIVVLAMDLARRELLLVRVDALLHELGEVVVAAVVVVRLDDEVVLGAACGGRVGVALVSDGLEEVERGLCCVGWRRTQQRIVSTLNKVNASEAVCEEEVVIEKMTACPVRGREQRHALSTARCN